MATVWFDGIEELTKLSTDLGELGQGAKPLARRAVQKTCADIKADAAATAPYRLGDLSSSIGYETRELAGAVIGEVGPTVEYGGYVEYGTSRMAPQPYMGPAFDRHAPSLEQALAAIVDRFGAS